MTTGGYPMDGWKPARDTRSANPDPIRKNPSPDAEETAREKEETRQPARVPKSLMKVTRKRQKTGCARGRDGIANTPLGRTGFQGRRDRPLRPRSLPRGAVGGLRGGDLRCTSRIKYEFGRAWIKPKSTAVRKTNESALLERMLPVGWVVVVGGLRISLKFPGVFATIPADPLFSIIS